MTGVQTCALPIYKSMDITYKLGKNSLNVLIVLDINEDHKSMDIIMEIGRASCRERV